MQDLVARPPQVHKYHQLMVKDNLEERISKTAPVLCIKPENIVRGSHASETASYVSIQCQNNSTIRALESL